jgi:ABC-type multidrug transport system ATPase subunit
MDATNTEDGGEKSFELRSLGSPQSLPDTFHVKEHRESSAYDYRDISLQEVTPVNVSIRHVTVSVDAPVARSASLLSYLSRKRNRDVEAGTFNRVKNILQDVSAEIPGGTLTAILGGSGSGKTTLLNVLSSRIHGRRLRRSGNITFNGSADIRKIRHAYVMQQDCLIPSLTVRETLQYAVDLRLREVQTRKARHQVVEEIILELGLKDCADTRIGDERTKGCSGGEKRRTSIGVQLCENPSVLFLDEPTTGLGG